ncbi:MAG: dTDP-4-dehydrorhamnose 3,5-epimerase [Deltaproteobacteria bacterium]|nr:dTDP-4-dehydrorhamnose 3,5-epimerase [Deltaproteobacteria bacterium]
MPVTVQPTEIQDVLVVQTGLVRDDRGYFAETWSATEFARAGLDAGFLQDNLSESAEGTLRGLHYQLAARGMAKLVRAVRGSVFDVAVDLRRGSPTFGRWVGRVLSAENRLCLWVPVGFAHGFLALEPGTLVHYKCTDTHAPEAERAVHHADPAIGIAWPSTPRLVSPKDAAAPPLAEAEYDFVYGG